MQATLIAEIGCNHKGDMQIAREMIRIISQFCQVPCAKFQKRTPKELLTREEYGSPHPDPHHSYGATYGEHREFLEFNVDQHRELQAYCREWNIAYTCSVWDRTAARDIVSLNPGMLKVPSACNSDFQLAAYLCDNFAGEIHVSLGMTSAAETQRIVDYYKQRGRGGDLVLYHCTSAYPVAFKDTHLLEIARLKERYGADVKAIGFSGHHLGIAVDVAAMALGATFFERHFTLDRTWKGTDHAASLEPDGLRRLWRDLRACQESLTYKDQEILAVEESARRKLKWDRQK